MLASAAKGFVCGLGAQGYELALRSLAAQRHRRGPVAARVDNRRADNRRAVMAEIETILRDNAVFIQPYGRSLYRHHKPEVVGGDMHPSFEIHVHKLGFKA